MKELPSKSDILTWVRANPDKAAKRDIARAFRVKGAARVELKRMLRELEADGAIVRGGRKQFREEGTPPPVGMLIVERQDEDGDLHARPEKWESETPAPPILIVPGSGEPALATGDRLLARLRRSEADPGRYEARMIRKIRAGPSRVIGVYRQEAEGGRLDPVDRKHREMSVAAGDAGGAREGELVEAEALSGPRMGLRRARIVEVLGDPGAPRAISLIALHQHDIPLEFPEDALAEAEAARPVAGLKGRVDLRDLPLITIDPADARDHDDAVAAAPDDDPANAGGHVVWVAIADVAYYARHGGALDRAARRRGNSTYFPDQVAPMLPERLSADLCSLREGEDRPCLAVRLVLDAEGELRAHGFHRGLMRSRAALSYEAAQAAAEGAPGAAAQPLMAEAIRPLFAAWRAAARARERRAPLHLDLPERRIELNAAGEVASVNFRERFDAHRLIEDFMILANVAAAETLEAKRRALLYRVHEEPNPLKLEALREQLETVGIGLPKGQILKTRHLNQALDAAAGGEQAEFVNMSVLRAQTQAYYAAENFGHFGLQLGRYAHFTSPIRRYADLVVHRALIAAHGWGGDGQTREEAEALEETATHVSMTERRSMEAERDTNDRYLAAYMADRVGAEFEGRVAGVARFGLFVRLDETGADGLVPISTLGDEYFRHDSDAATLTGERSGRTIHMGARAKVKLKEAAPLTGGLLFELLEVDGFGRPARPAARRPARGAPKRKLSKAKLKRAREAKKAKRRG